jgi:hypothetical protein
MVRDISLSALDRIQDLLSNINVYPVAAEQHNPVARANETLTT